MPAKGLRSEAEYVPLMTEESGGDPSLGSPENSSPTCNNEDKEDEVSGLEGNSSQCRLSRTLKFFLYAALTMSFLSFASSALTFIGALRDNANRLDARFLDRPSLYLGVERAPAIKEKLVHHPVMSPGLDGLQNHGHGHEVGLHKPSMSSNPDAIKPNVMHRISSLHPTMTFVDDDWITLTEWDSMLVSFELPQSLTSEKCVATAYIPSQSVDALEDRQVTIEPGGRAYVQVWEVSPLSLSENNVTFGKKPHRLANLGTLEVGFGLKSFSGAVICRAGRTVTLELVCPPKFDEVGCRVEFINMYPDLGIALTPHI